MYREVYRWTCSCGRFQSFDKIEVDRHQHFSFTNDLPFGHTAFQIFKGKPHWDNS